MLTEAAKRNAGFVPIHFIPLPADSERPSALITVVAAGRSGAQFHGGPLSEAARQHKFVQVILWRGEDASELARRMDDAVKTLGGNCLLEGDVLWVGPRR
jgi:hypothetical protein